PELPTQPAAKNKQVKAGKQSKAAGKPSIISYRHTDKRRNNPEVGMVNESTDPADGKDRWCYDPHIDPALQFDFGRAQVEKLIDDALESGDPGRMRAVLEDLKRYSAPYLNWTGKAECTTFDVDTVSLHVHERIDPASILSAVRKKIKEGKGGSHQQPDLFAAPFENLPLRDAIDFYKHEKGWSNRLIAGDSLQVMNSLLQKEGMAGQVQMIYIDPPYGIKYGSNFQPFVNKRDVKDRKDEDLTQEPEMIKAFRDTWELGIHSYLTYLRDRLLLAKELLNESGSVFVQIGDENLHFVRQILDEIFGAGNFSAQISFKATDPLGQKGVAKVYDYLVWYAKNLAEMRFRQIYRKRDILEDKEYRFIDRYPGEDEPSDRSSDEFLSRVYRRRNATSSGFTESCTFDLEFQGRPYPPPGKKSWSSNSDGMSRVIKANRIFLLGKDPYYKQYQRDFPLSQFENCWTDKPAARGKQYVVETAEKFIARCLLMTTDPGDLVLDPTCGSGTTAFVAEKWGRRWITCDTSRVSVTLAKQRLMTANFDFYALRYPQEGLKGGFINKTVPHVTLKSIANNPEVDEIYAAMHPAIEAALADLNKPLDSRLRGNDGLKEWEVPFEFPGEGKDAWTEAARKPFEVFHAARRAMQARMDASIAAHADQETLYDQPEIEKNKLRITGPFSVEAVPFPSVLSLEKSEQPIEADAAIARSGESARQHQWRDELLKTGIRGKGGDQLKFADLETLPGTQQLHASGHLVSDSDTPGDAGLGGERVVVSFGPEYAALEQRQVEHALSEAAELFPRPKLIVFCAFAFDPEAAKDIDQLKGITALKAQMNTDLLTEDLKKGRSSNQSFWLMGQPDVELRQRKDDKYEVEVNGFDYFDTRSGELISGGKGKIAMWSLDTDYDERSLYPRQVFFPMAGKQDGWYKLKKNIRAELNESLLDKFHGTVSLPFEAGENRKVAVKIVDDRGIESLKIIPIG
ncbi:MAG: site-specific DNA-methyltransferase, partial [Gammaproteobacteria bacterium]